MRTSGFVIAAGALVGVLFASVCTASAEKKLTYAQAFAKCKEEISKNLPGESLATGPRYSAGGACMHRYGYRLKK
jgi:hypothetical protein